MTKKLSLLVSQHFRQLLENAADFYARHASAEIAGNFLDSVEQAIMYIAQNPHASMRYIPPDGFPEFEILNYRIFNLKISSPFPYSIYYEMEEDAVVIHSLYHHSQNRELHVIK